MKPGKPWSHTAELPVVAASAFKARDFVGKRLIEHGLSYLADDVQLVVSELATNALIHAQTPFTVTLQALGRSVLLMVEDGSTAGPLYVATRDLDVGGRGIRIVQALSRDWGVSVDAEGGKSMWAVFDTRQAPVINGRSAAGAVAASGSTHAPVIIRASHRHPAG